MTRTTGRWWVYRGDGSVFSHEDGSPFDCPRSNCQIILQDHSPSPSGLCLTMGKDYYYWQDGEGWWPTDLGGLFEWLDICPPNRLQILTGRNCPDFEEIKKRAIAHKRELIGSAA